MSKGMNINQWAEADRPREKMATKGAGALSDAELLAILVGSGSTDESAVDLMRRVLADCDNNLNTLGRMTIDQLCSYKGVGPAKAITILAACEVGKRWNAAQAPARETVDSSDIIFRVMYPLMRDLDHEECWVLLLDSALQVIDKVCVSRGGLNSTLVDVRIVLREALLKQAPLIVLCHNHPSGQVQPSADDNRLTEQVRKAAATVNIRLIDHLVIGNGRYYSYNDEGKI